MNANAITAQDFQDDLDTWGDYAADITIRAENGNPRWEK